MRVNKLLAIAITDYEEESLNKLENCYSDINEITKVLNDRYEFDEIEIIHERQQTTRKILYSVLNEYFIHSLPDDNILVLYSGHGDYNDILGSAYWLPSDADSTDPTSWINLNDILSFIRVSEAKHVGIISDSCFAGGIFQLASRGGGIIALDSKKSREALTSGSKEKVSDGKKGDSSPFTKTLLDVLIKNETADLPFSALANQVILEFDPDRKQTPQFGSLSNAGHEGGTFIFKRKLVEHDFTEIHDPKEYLKKKLSNLYIELPPSLLGLAKKTLDTVREKHLKVKKQQFEEAAKLRDEEKQLYKAIDEDITLLLQKLSNVKLTEEDISESLKMNEEFSKYSEDAEIEKKDFEKLKSEWEKKKEVVVSTIPKGEVEEGVVARAITMVWSNPAVFGFSMKENPINRRLLNIKNEFARKYNSSILELLQAFLQFKGNSQVPFLEHKERQLFNTIQEVIKLEISILTRRFKDNVDEAIDKKQIELEMLKWIQTVE